MTRDQSIRSRMMSDALENARLMRNEMEVYQCAFTHLECTLIRKAASDLEHLVRSMQNTDNRTKKLAAKKAAANETKPAL